MNNKDLLDIVITDEDIKWVENIMGGKIHFDTDRINVLKNMSSTDIQAFPGSGKTTILVAKLAILARKWTYGNSGICVLSHTNVAREEIEDRLGNTEIGRKLLSYPHFIGTVHSFFDTYIALPWLKSNGYDINTIDTSLVTTLRWNRLPYNTRSYLERQFKNEAICEYKNNIGLISWDKNGMTKEQLLSVIEKTQKEGYFTFGEMLLYAKRALDEWEEMSNAIQKRFPILFIDEAQDTDSFQWNLLKRAFNMDGIKSIRQGFGDSNQAIYGNINMNDESDDFPRPNELVLKESRRFDSNIANLANTVALSKDQMNGTDNIFTKREISNTIFLFKKENANQVIDSFGKLVLASFSDDDLKIYESEGIHVIGMVHEKKEETKEEHFPKGIYDYWEPYRAKKSKKNSNPLYLIEYFRNGIFEFYNTGEKSIQLEWICKGLRRLVNKMKKSNYIPATGNALNSIVKLLNDEQINDFKMMLKDLADYNNPISHEEWKEILKKTEKILNYFDTKINTDAKSFTKWMEFENISNEKNDNKINVLPNHYIYIDEETSRTVDMEFGSIHSVKGRTHLATLVLETYMKSHNMKSILKYLCGDSPKTKNRPEKKLRCQYVAMTRARALLCLAIPVDFVDEKTQGKLKQIGWNLKFV